MTQLELQQDLNNALEDGETFVREQLRSSFRYLAEAQSFPVAAIRCIVDDLLSEITPRPRAAGLHLVR